jgi:predicted nucleic acid-binding protein
MTFVVDASIAAYWMLPDENSDLADRVMLRLAEGPARVPSQFWHEARSLFLKAERRGRLAAGGAAAPQQRLWRLPIEDTGAGADAAVFALAVRHGLSTYDATYLALALAEQIPIATLDTRLAAAARLEAVAVLGPLETA